MSLLCLLLAGICTTLSARSAGNPDLVALGGSTAYISGIDAHFHNPANLLLQNRLANFQILLGTGSVYDSQGARMNNLNHFPDQLTQYFYSHSYPQAELWSAHDIANIFGDSDRYRQTRRYEFIPVGFRWSDGASARSFAIRTRGISSFQISRSWFDPEPTITSGNADEELSISRKLSEQYHVYHEISVGFAREVTMFNRWRADLSTLNFGVSPKFILGGMHSDSEYLSHYTRSGDEWDNTKHLNSHVTGDLDRFVSGLIKGADPRQAYRDHMSQTSNLEINGLGMGLDAGLTYIIPLGNDIALSPHVDRPLRKSLRISVAIHDLGAIRYHNHDGKRESRTITRTYDDLPETDTGFNGRPAAFFQYIAEDESERAVFDNITTEDESSYYIQLPTELHLGAALQYNWIVAIVDLNYRFNAFEFEMDGWRTSIGSEIRLLPFLPIKGSIQVAPDGSLSFGAGLGLDVGPVSTSGAIRIYRNSDREESRWLANSISGLSMRISF